jgi:hypothetical protein
MTKKQKNFEFNFPLSQKVVENLRIVTKHIGDLEVSGVAYFNPNVSALDLEDNRYSADIDFVKWNGTDIKPVLEALRMLDDIEEAAIRHAAYLFTEKTAA